MSMFGGLMQRGGTAKQWNNRDGMGNNMGIGRGRQGEGEKQLGERGKDGEGWRR